LVGIASPSLAMAQTAFQRGSDRLRFGVAARLASPPPLRGRATARASLRRVCAARRARTSEKGCGGDVRIASLRVRRRAARPIGRDVERSKSPKNQRLTIANEDGAADGRAAQERKRGGAVDGPRPQDSVGQMRRRRDGVEQRLQVGAEIAAVDAGVIEEA
jgi:hypothetical protein